MTTETESGRTVNRLTDRVSSSTHPLPKASAGPPDSPAPVDPMLHFVDQKNSLAAEEGCTRKALQVIGIRFPFFDALVTFGLHSCSAFCLQE